jgi:hypothetical protein
LELFSTLALLRKVPQNTFKKSAAKPHFWKIAAKYFCKSMAKLHFWKIATKPCIALLCLFISLYVFMY